jgi:hypothetical protein
VRSRSLRLQRTQRMAVQARAPKSTASPCSGGKSTTAVVSVSCRGGGFSSLRELVRLLPSSFVSPSLRGPQDSRQHRKPRSHTLGASGPCRTDRPRTWLWKHVGEAR